MTHDELEKKLADAMAENRRLREALSDWVAADNAALAYTCKVNGGSFSVQCRGSEEAALAKDLIEAKERAKQALNNGGKDD